MRTKSVVSSALLVLGLAAAASAQEAQSQAAPPAATPRAAAADSTHYGLNLARIQRELQKSAERQEYDGLNLRYYVNGYAPSPSIKLFTPLDNLLYGQAPYGGPTHREMMDLITPREYRAPVADFSGVARWLANKSKTKK
jgi:hypothetical protein